MGTKAVNALSSNFIVQSVRDGKTVVAEFERGVLVKEQKHKTSAEPNGTLITFVPDENIF